MKSLERFSAFLFLLLLALVILFLTYNPINEGSKEIVMMAVGALTTACATSIPKLIGSSEIISRMEERIKQLESILAVEISRRESQEEAYKQILEKLSVKLLDKE